MGCCYERLGQFWPAARLFSRAMHVLIGKKKDGMAPALLYYNRGVCFLHLELHRLALNDFNTAVTLRLAAKEVTAAVYSSMHD